MRIDNAISSYFAAQRTVSSTSRESSSSTATSSASSTTADKVTISAAGKDAAAKFASTSSTQAAAHPFLEYRDQTLRDAKADPEFAAKTAYEFAQDDSFVLHGPMVDITQEPMRYSATGEVVTEKGVAEFKAQASKARDELITLYQSEKGKGTPDAQILEKLFSARDAQPDSYLKKLNWERADTSVQS
jgi:hypothetical protein